jgi:hypothetical protein
MAVLGNSFEYMKDIYIEGESILQLRTSDSHYFKELYFEGENFKGY